MKFIEHIFFESFSEQVFNGKIEQKSKRNGRKNKNKIRTKIKQIFKEFLFGGLESLPDKAYLTNSLSSSLVAINDGQTLSVLNAFAD